MGGFERHADTLSRLGKRSTRASCLYLNRLSDVDLDVLGGMVRDSLAYMDQTYPESP